MVGAEWWVVGGWVVSDGLLVVGAGCWVLGAVCCLMLAVTF